MTQTGVLSRARRGIPQKRRAQRQYVISTKPLAAVTRAQALVEGLARLDREHFALLAATSADSAALGNELGALLRSELQRTQRALMRAAAGRYGECERCEEPFSARQILRDPARILCSRCARVPRDQMSFS